ncbi:MAG TPA: hypothetical protein VK133_03460 [Amoebophilaceae bacterium]|nr:hypothetical protein [Amoebophilaceae bacterium]
MQRSLVVSRFHWPLLCANVLIHFDNALYAYLIPVLAPLLFPDQTLVVQLMLGYGVWGASFVAKPMGVFLFGTMVLRRKEVHTLRCALIGAGLSLLFLSILPFGSTLWHVVLLLMARMGIEACAAGTHSIVKLYLLQGADAVLAKKKAVWYEMAGMVGILLASVCGTWFACMDHPLCYWQLPFLAGGISTMGITFLFGKGASIETTCMPQVVFPKGCRGVGRQLWNERRAIVRIALATGFSYMTYVIPFVCMNGFVPLLTNISYTAMMQHTTGLMVLDVLLLGLLGQLCPKYNHNNILAVVSGLLAVTIVPLFGGLRGASMVYATGVRIWVFVLGVLFCSCLNIWCKEQVSKQDATAYLTVGFATVLGSSLFGKTTPAICFALFDGYQSPLAPACYLAGLAFCTMLVMANSASDA